MGDDMAAGPGYAFADVPPDPPDAGGWTRFLQRDDKGNPVPNLANAAHALREASDLAGLVAFDGMAQLPMLMRAPRSWRLGPVAAPRPLTDADAAAILERLQREAGGGMRRLSKETAHQALDLVARERAFHPVRDWLRGLRWDGGKRLDTWLSYYLGADPTPYTAAIGRMFLVGMVARVVRPGCKADHMMVLEGPQGTGKSTACAALAGEWFGDNLPDVGASDPVRLSMYLRGKWLIEVSEMSAMGRAEAGKLKAFLTTAEERYVPKYGRQESVEPRQCVFVGTTNKSAYLRDETGNRRFWPVKVGRIDIDALRRDRDQLFAEAVAAFDAGADWWPDRDFEASRIAPEQDARFEADAWEAAVLKHIRGRDRATIPEIAREALCIETGRLGTADQRRIVAILESGGWKPKRDKKGRYWVRGGDGR
jgi:predicted P-loop ATPase